MRTALVTDALGMAITRRNISVPSSVVIDDDLSTRTLFATVVPLTSEGTSRSAVTIEGGESR